ncbi:MAG: GbsR/MarR family transcriptional regulator [Halobacteriaceae archaeon]
MSDDVAAARERVIEAMARSAEMYGLNRSYGRLYGILYFAAEPMSLDDLSAESDYAKSTVSTAMQALERYHLVRRSGDPSGGRRAFFEAERDWWTVLQELVQGQVRREFRTMRRALDDAEAMLEGAEGAEAERYRRRVHTLQEMYDQFEIMVDLFTKAPAERLLSVASKILGNSGDSNS